MSPWKAVPSSPSAWEAEVRESHRLFSCARCGRQVRICSACDRGNIYCSDACAQARRRASVREAGRRYQQNPLGRRNHARRQRAYRARQKQNVTHQGSGEAPTGGEVRPGDEMRPSEGGLALAEEPNASHVVPRFGASACTCDLCGREVSPFARLDFLTTPCSGGWP